MTQVLRKIDALLLKIQNAILIFSTSVIILLMCAGVVMRYFLHSNFNGLEELILLLGFWIYFFGSSVAFRDDDHMEASILQPLLRTDKERRIYAIVRNAVSLPVIAVAAIWTAKYVQWSFMFWPTTVVYNLPYVVAQVPLLLCFILAFVYTAANLWRAAAGLRPDSPDLTGMEEAV